MEQRNEFHVPYDAVNASDWSAYRRKPQRQVGTTRDMIFAGCFLVLSILCVNFFLWGGRGAAACAGALGLYITGLCYVYPHRVGYSGYACCCGILYFLCAVSLMFSDHDFGKTCVMVAMSILSTVTLMELRGLRRWRAGSLRGILDVFSIGCKLPVKSIPDTLYGLFHREDGEGTQKNRSIGPVLLGLLCAVPMLLVIVPLLSSADAAFDQLFQNMTLQNSDETIKTLILGVGLFILVFGQYFAARRMEPPEEGKRVCGQGIEPAALIAFLSMISLVYVLYLISQFAYFFSGFSGLLPDNYSVAQYARRGFFEMVLICLLNLLIVFASLLAVKKKEGREPGTIRWFSLFLCGFSLLLIATALSKMILYIDSFGMTHLRILTSVFMLFLAVVFVTVVLRLFIRKLRYMKIILIAAMLLVVAMGFADLDRVVAAYNVEAYRSGQLDSIDMEELSSLSSDGIVPYVFKLTREDSDIASSAYRILQDKLLEHKLAVIGADGMLQLAEGSYDWRSYSIPGNQAFCLLREHARQIIYAGT